ncbi:hypothetical protein [Micromonospora sp. NPDC049679]|uniref:hypothetical protein n=1 Tax=Micromonospora sp. NPDC049679 TaxID=3155920 RepID=UPI0033E1F5FA
MKVAEGSGSPVGGTGCAGADGLAGTGVGLLGAGVWTGTAGEAEIGAGVRTGFAGFAGVAVGAAGPGVLVPLGRGGVLVLAAPFAPEPARLVAMGLAGPAMPGVRGVVPLPP